MAAIKVPAKTRSKRRMQYAVMKFLSAAPGWWGAMAISEALCSDTKGNYGGRNPWRLLSTVNSSLYRLCEIGNMERRGDKDDTGRPRYVYTLTDKGRRDLKELEE